MCLANTYIYIIIYIYTQIDVLPPPIYSGLLPTNRCPSSTPFHNLSGLNLAIL